MPRRPKNSEPFELDLASYELRRAGRAIRLERIPMELLILLVGNRGRLLTRDEIAGHLWGKNAYLDTDRNLNTAVGKIRRALGDDAEQPKFVETVVGKGYRFVANGAFVLRQPTDKLSPIESPPPPAAATISAPAGLEKLAPTTETANPNRRLPVTWLTLLATVASCVTSTYVWMGFGAKSPPWLRNYDQITNDGRKKAFTIDNIPLPIVTDGSRLYFSLNTATGGFDPAVVSAAGGETGTIATTLRSATVLDVSSDGSGMLLASPAVLPESPLWFQPLPGGPPRRAGEFMAQSASWSPDAKRFAFSNSAGLFSASRDATGLRAIVMRDRRTGEQIYWPRWSPDGSCLRYSLYSPRTGFHTLWQVASDGGRPRRLLSGWNATPHECCGSWTLDGRFFVFASMRNGRSDVWEMPERTGLLWNREGAPVQVTAGPLSFFAPVPAAGGHLYMMGVETRGELFRYEMKSRTFSQWSSGISATGVDFSRDGRWMCYTSYPDHILSRSRIDGTDRLQLTAAPMLASLPRWSPDGNRIAFYGRTPGKPYQVYLAPAAGGSPEIIRGEPDQQLDPTWSADGAFLVFERAPWQERGGHRRTSIAVLTVKTGEIAALPGSEGLVSPRYSPDGRFIAAMSADSGRLFVDDVKTGRWRSLLTLHIGYPNWSRDGKWIYFDRFEAPKGIARIRVSDGKLENVLTPANGDELWTLDTWTALAPDDSVLLLRDASVSEIYALKAAR